MFRVSCTVCDMCCAPVSDGFQFQYICSMCIENTLLLDVLLPIDKHYLFPTPRGSELL